MATDEYSDIHRGFLQVVMSRGTISKTVANKVLDELLAKHNQIVPTNMNMKLESAIDLINEKIGRFDQRIDVVTSMYDGKEFVVMVSTTDSAMKKLKTTYIPNEIEFFQLLMREIALAEDHSMGMIAVLNLTNQIENRDVNFTMMKVEKLVDYWVEEGYFYMVEGIVYLGVRAVAEFGAYLRSKYNVDKCDLCNAIWLKGVDCENDNCEGRFHTECIRKFMTSNANCPQCKMAWKNPIP